MSIALLIQSTNETLKEQTLLVPTDTDVLVFHRATNGGRGRGQAWQIVTDLETIPSTPVTIEPQGVILSPRDVTNASIGNVTALAIKAMANLDTATETPAISHFALAVMLKDSLIHGDQFITKYVRDGRRSNPIVLKPIKELEPAFYPVISPEVANEVSTPEVAPTLTPSSFIKPEFELAKVPDRKWADEYLNRKIEGGVLDFAGLDVALKNKQNVLIRGGAGSGKTMCVLAWASTRGYRYYNVSANVGLEPSHLFGAWTPTEQAGVFRWQDGPVTDLVRHGGVLLLNEIDFMPERVTTVLFGLLDDRREIQLLEHGGEVIKAHPDLIVIGDHNPNYRGSRPMNQAWKDRFAHKWEFGYDKAIEKKLIKNEALLQVANQLRSQADKGEIDTPISTRGLVAFIKNVEALGLDYAVQSYINGFLDDEREAVKLVMDTAKANIASGFGIATDISLQADEN